MGSGRHGKAWGVVMLAGLVALGTGGCVESSTHGRTAFELQQVHQGSYLQAQRLRELELTVLYLTWLHHQQDEATRQARLDQIRELETAKAVAAQALALAAKLLEERKTGAALGLAVNEAPRAAIALPGSSVGAGNPVRRPRGEIVDPWRPPSPANAPADGQSQHADIF